MHFSTKAIHKGWKPDESSTGSVMPPIYLSSTFELEAPGQSRGFEYARANHPNAVILEEVLAALEEGAYATVFSSGMGALTALASTLKQGDRVVAICGVYGGTYRLFSQILNRFGVEWIHLLKPSVEEVEKVLATGPKWLMFETPTNPLMQILDIEAWAKRAKTHGVLTVIDNTFASPYCQNPLKLGAAIVWHSTTKYIGGHSDVLGGVVISNDKEIKKQLDFARKTLGNNPSPFDSWLLTRGVKTLAIRMEKHAQNGLGVAQFLETRPEVRRVYYPGLPTHPDYEIALKQMRCWNGMLSADFQLPLDKVFKLLSSFRYFTLAESLGGVESLVSHPATMTHAVMSKKEREILGITDGLVRFSVGIEDLSDLLEDLEAAFKHIG